MRKTNELSIKIEISFLLPCNYPSFLPQLTFFGWLLALRCSLQQSPLEMLQSVLVLQSSPETKKENEDEESKDRKQKVDGGGGSKKTVLTLLPDVMIMDGLEINLARRPWGKKKQYYARRRQRAYI
jgi:hypothetical protein